VFESRGLSTRSETHSASNRHRPTTIALNYPCSATIRICGIGGAHCGPVADPALGLPINLVAAQLKGSTWVPKRYVFTGAPGSGKTALLGALRQLGHFVVEEARQRSSPDCRAEAETSRGYGTTSST